MLKILFGIFFVVILLIVYLSVTNPAIYRFYSKKCKHCITSYDEWKKFRLAHTDISTFDLDINDPKNKDLVEKFNAFNVPSVWKEFPSGRRVEYTGDRSAVSYYEFYNKW